MNIRTAFFALALAGLAATSASAAPTKMMDTNLGSVLVDQNGMTLYTFDKDEPGKTNCYDQCAVNWPPFYADTGAKPEGDLTLVKRNDGTEQWAYEGMPLYYWKADTKPGQTTGNGIGGVWHVVK